MNYKVWLCFDFDGVISEYDGWKGFDVLGKPKTQVINAINALKKEGFYITIFTTRLATPTLEKWLKENGCPFDSINSNAHNPPNTSQKPIYHVIIDDRAVGYNGQDTEKLMRDIKEVLVRI